MRHGTAARRRPEAAKSIR